MKEDVLEQLVDDYLRSLGFFTQGNVKFRPSHKHVDYAGNKDTGFSGIDVIGYAAERYGADRVWVVSCKAWQEGLDPGKRLDELNKGSDEWRRHRELWSPKWGQALCDAVEELTGQRAFRHFTAVTRLKGQVGRWHEWRDDPQIRLCLEGNWVGFLRLEDMWERTVATATTTLAGSVMGRLAQMLKAAGQVAVTSPLSGADEQLTKPHEDFAGFPSVAGMWLPPPPVGGVEEINRYAHTVNGYNYAELHYGTDEASPQDLHHLLRSAPPRAVRSFELLRLEQFFAARGWHHSGYWPEDGPDLDSAMQLHQVIQAAWVNQQFDRGHKEPLKPFSPVRSLDAPRSSIADRLTWKAGDVTVTRPNKGD